MQCAENMLTSFDADVFFGASLTLPEGPLGKTKMPPSAPEAMARLRFELLVAFCSSLYCSSAYCGDL